MAPFAYLAPKLFKKEGNRLAMEVTGGRRKWCVDVSMSIYPDQAEVWALLGMTFN